MDGIGSSDHIPIIIKAATKVNYQSVRGSEAKWRIKDVDWTKFSEVVDAHLDIIRKEENQKHQFTTDESKSCKTEVGNELTLF